MNKIVNFVKDFLDGIIDSIITSRSAFIIATIAVTAQVYHTYNTAEAVSSIEGDKQFQALLLSLVFSLGVMFCTIIQGSSKDVIKANAVGKAASLFMFFDIGINLYYYIYYLVLEPEGVNWKRLPIGIIYAIALPIVIRYFAGHIKANSNTETKLRLKEELDEVKKEFEKYKEYIESINNTLIDNNYIIKLQGKAYDFNLKLKTE